MLGGVKVATLARAPPDFYWNKLSLAAISAPHHLPRRSMAQGTNQLGTPGHGSAGKRSHPRFSMTSPAHRHDSFGAVERTLSAQQLIDPIFAQISADGDLSPGSLSRLLAIYKQTTLDAAFSLVDKRMVQKLVTASGRSLFLVESSGETPYVCFKHYCPCPYYAMSVVSRPEALACKHMLAARLGEALGKIEVLDASNDDYGKWLRQQEEAALTQASKTPNKSFRRGDPASARKA